MTRERHPASQSEHLSYAENFFGIRRYSSLASSEAKNPRRKNFRKIYAKPPLRLPRVGRFPLQYYNHAGAKTNPRYGLERTGADIGTAPAGGDAIFAPASEEKSAMQGWNTLVVRPSIGEDGELSEPEAPAGARFPLPALPARAELRDAEVHAMLGELDFGESAVMGDATAEERQAIANFDIRAYA